MPITLQQEQTLHHFALLSPWHHDEAGEATTWMCVQPFERTLERRKEI
jgi:hypothetical protein